MSSSPAPTKAAPLKRGTATVLDSSRPLGDLLHAIITGASQETMAELVVNNGDLWAQLHKPNDLGRDERRQAPSGIHLGRACVPWLLDLIEEHRISTVRVTSGALQAINYDYDRGLAERIAEALRPVADAGCFVGVEYEARGAPPTAAPAPAPDPVVIDGLLRRGVVTELPESYDVPSLIRALTTGTIDQYNGHDVTGGAAVFLDAEQFALRLTLTELGGREIAHRFVPGGRFFNGTAAGWVGALVDGAAAVIVGRDVRALAERNDHFAIDWAYLAEQHDVAVAVVA